ncbi:MAG TPA: hypothetical protein ENJ35_08460 [Gammaproteobacteria bacterium]|nr:hypothetical protein [Gammaproteobacteria bacterium]
MKNQTPQAGHRMIGKVPHPSANDDMETAEIPCIILGWSSAVTFKLIDHHRYIVEPKEISRQTTTRDIAAAIERIASYSLEEKIESRTVLRTTGRRFADLLTEWVPEEGCSIEMDTLKYFVGMVLYFARTIHHEPQLSLHEREILQLINQLPAEALEIASQEALEFLRVHGFKSISRKIVIASDTVDVSIALQGCFAERPEPSLATEPITYTDVRVKSLDYGKSRAALASPAAGNLVVNIEEKILLEKLHAAGLEGTKLICTTREVLAAQNRKELQLVEVQLQPNQP